LKEMGADYVLVHGDTLTTFAVAWAAFLEGLPVGHVEAGLRSHNLKEPFPEEANRRLTDALTDLDFAPTPLAKENLLREGKREEGILVTGQTGVDAVLLAARLGRLPEGLPPGPYVTVTMHRRENWPLLPELARALKKVAEAFPEITFVYPVHLNPVVREAVFPVLKGVRNFVLLDPLDYGPMAALMKASLLLVTDSGGLQEEGAALGVPVVVLRNVTERPEGLQAGILKLAGTDPEGVYSVVRGLLENPEELERMRRAKNPYGDGQAGVRVARGVAWRLGLGPRPEDWTP
jgi:UDP-N-acetylglucosamine 2-epimerase (non-hydrolysing)